MKEREKFEKWWSERGFMLGTRAVTSKIWQAALSSSPTPPEVEPIGFIRDPDESVAPLYTHPAPNDELRAAAEAISAYLDKPVTSVTLTSLRNNLRSALGKKEGE